MVWGECCLKMSALEQLRFWIDSEDSERKDHLMNESINGVYRTAPAIPGLLIIPYPYPMYTLCLASPYTEEH